jgi:hypothetical protein
MQYKKLYCVLRVVCTYIYYELKFGVVYIYSGISLTLCKATSDRERQREARTHFYALFVQLFAVAVSFHGSLGRTLRRQLVF